MEFNLPCYAVQRLANGFKPSASNKALQRSLLPQAATHD
jgi:hypothetical protein